MAKGGASSGFAGVLTNMLSEVGQAMTLPDADLEFLNHLQQMLVARARAMGQAQQGGGLPGQPGMGAGGPAGGLPAPTPFPGQNIPSPMPPVDELRRLVSQQGAA